METNRLHQFRVTVETGNLRKAAELLGISHSGLSKSLQQLQNDLQVKLFVQHGRLLRLTKDGERTYKEAQKVLEAVELLKPKKNFSASQKIYSIGTFEVFSTYFLPHLIKEISKGVSIEILELIPGQLERALLEERIDVGVTYLPIPHPGLEHIEVGRICMKVLGPSNASFTVKKFSDLPFVVPTTSVPGTPTKVQGLDGWPDDLHPRNIKFRVTLMESALELVRSGLAVAYLPEFVVELHNKKSLENFWLKKVSVPFNIESHQRLYMVRRKSDEEPYQQRKIAKALRQLK